MNIKEWWRISMIYFLFKMIKKMNNLRLKIKLYYYKKLFHMECKSCGKNPRIIFPISLKGLNNCKIGDNFKLDYNGIFETWSEHNGKKYTPSIIIGNNVSIGKRCHIGCINSIIIDDDVLIGSDVMIIDHNHGLSDFSDLNISPNQRLLSSNGEIHICKNVWIGEKVSILSGVIIGENSIIGANSVVTHSFPENCIICGNPAKIIRKVQVDK
ncbi:acyltransferase [Ruminococcus albus]|nr:acyltransferase [Ruminococcus albus]